MADRYNFLGKGGQGVIYNSQTNYSYTPGFKPVQFASFSRNLSVPVILGLPAESNNATYATSEFIYMYDEVGLKNLYVEIGNEPQKWTHFNEMGWQQHAADDSVAAAAQYAHDVQNITSQIQRIDPGARFITYPGGGAGANGEQFWINTTLDENCRNTSAIAIHAYPDGSGRSGETLQSFMTSLIASPAALDVRVPLDRAAIAAHCPGIPLYVDEFGPATTSPFTSPFLSGFPDVLYTTGMLVQGMELNLTNMDLFCIRGSYQGCFFPLVGPPRLSWTLYSQVLSYLPTNDAQVQNVSTLTDYARGNFVESVQNATSSAILVDNTNLTQPLNLNLTSLGLPAGRSVAITWNNTSGLTPPPTFHGWSNSIGANWSLPPASLAVFRVNSTGLLPPRSSASRADTRSQGTVTNLSWVRDTQSPGPSAREWMASAFDAMDNYTLFFGGFNGKTLGDTWSFRGDLWNNITLGVGASPPERYGAGMTYDTPDHMIVMFGGRDSNGTLLDDTWGFSNNRWNPLTSVNKPPARAFMGLTTDNATGNVTLFGGVTSNGGSPTTIWTFRDRTVPVWTARSESTTPPGVSGPGFSQYLAGGYAFLYGGWNETTGYLNETWKLTRGVWSNLTPARSPGPFANSSMAYDKWNKYLLMFGGLTPTGFSNQTWTWTGSDWAQVNSVTSPMSRSNASLAPDLADSEMVLFGGTNGSGRFLNDTWIWTGSLNATLHGSVKVLLIGNSMTYTADVFGGLSPYHYLWEALPPGCASVDVNPLPCTPTAVGPYNSRVQVNDSMGNFVITNYFHLLVTTPNNLSVSLSILPSDHIGIGQAAYFWAHATGEPLYYAYNWTQLLPMPPGCFQNDSPVIGCYPTAAGTFPVEVNVSDFLGHSRIGFANITVISGISANLLVSPKPDEVGFPVSFKVPAAGGLQPFSYDYLFLPPGCASANVSTLTCVPTLAGNYPVQAVVTDATGLQVYTAPVELTVVPHLTASLSASNTSLIVGRPLTLTVFVTNGVGPYWVNLSGMPPGCIPVNTKALVCRPSVPGDYSIRAQVTDSLGVAVETNPVNLTVMPASPTCTQCHVSATLWPWYVVPAGIGGAVVAMGVTLVVIRRRMKGRRGQGGPDDQTAAAQPDTELRS